LDLTALVGAFLLLNVPVNAAQDETLRGLLKLRPNLTISFCFLSSRLSWRVLLWNISKILAYISSSTNLGYV
jgi:hypothetical protein